MEYLCPVCEKPYDGVFCTACTTSSHDAIGHNELAFEETETAYLVDLVTNRKIPIVTPICKCGRDESNNIVISGDQSISRNHFTITKEGNQYFVKDENSRHGTFLNGKQLFTLEEVNDGDVLKVGVSLFWFVLEAAGVSAKPSGNIANKDNQPHTFQTNAKAGEQGGAKVEPGASMHPGKGVPAMSNEDLATITSDNIPVIVADDALASKHQFKTHSFDASKQSNLSAHPAKAPKRPSEQALATNPTAKVDLPEPAQSLDSSDADEQMLNSEIASVTEQDNSDDLAELKEPQTQPLSAEDLIKSLDFDADEPKANKEKEPIQSKPAKSKNDSIGKVRSSSGEPPKGMGGFLEKIGATVGGNKGSAQPRAEGKGLGSVLSSSSTDTSKPKEAPRAQAESQEAALNSSQPEPMAKDMKVLGTNNDQSGALAESAIAAASELKQLDEQLTNLGEQLRLLQQKFEDMSNHVAQLGKMRNTLFAVQTLKGEDLTSSCFKVFAQIGFKVSLIEPEPGKEGQELKLDTPEVTAIVRMVGPLGDDERTQLGQLTMSQARFWLDGKSEPKGILVVSSSGETTTGLLNERNFSEDLAKYAMKKNVCLMTTSQLLSIYSSMMNDGAQPLQIQNQILETNGWLRGFVQEVSTSSGDNTDKVDRLSYLLSA